MIAANTMHLYRFSWPRVPLLFILFVYVGCSTVTLTFYEWFLTTSFLGIARFALFLAILGAALCLLLIQKSRTTAVFTRKQTKGSGWKARLQYYAIVLPFIWPKEDPVAIFWLAARFQ